MRYSLHRPVGGHGSTFLDVLYLDRDLSITRGNHGTIFVQARNCPSAGGASSTQVAQGAQGGNAAAANPATKKGVGSGSAERRKKSRADAVRKATAA